MFNVTTNVPEYTSTLRLYARARKKPHAEVVNRFASQANFFMARPEASGGVRRAKLGKFPLNASADPERGEGGTFKSRFFFAHQASHGVKKGAGGEIVMRPAAKRAWLKRRAARGAMAAGFLVSARKLGLKKRGAKSVQPRPGGGASASAGMKARTSRPKAFSVNKIKGSYEVGRRTMDKAIRHTVKDARKFALQLLQDENNRAMKRRLPVR